MILVAIVAEVLEEYTALLARVVEQVFRSAPVPRRVRFLILHSLPFTSSHPRTLFESSGEFQVFGSRCLVFHIGI
ncbi:hypothetical protein Ahy_B10g100590 [Arachis hypogaea]|uniref:Uncharacterized protein n=1 Tax=Arachis hypogaea TaxID=3818 RepID=A0A444WX87_ARAHY|nr:hypothetical protein Ahy_B10g100590 [Arachis hypogaea]